MSTGKAATTENPFHMISFTSFTSSTFSAGPPSPTSSIESWLETTFQESSGVSAYRLARPSKRKRSLPSTPGREDGNLIKVPLKKQFLLQHLAAMDTTSTSQIAHNDVNASTDSKSKTTDKTALSAKERMRQQRIYQEHSNFENYPAFQEVVRRPFQQGHHNSVRPLSQDLFNSRFDYYKDGNEESFKHKQLNVIIKDEFNILLVPDEDGEEPVYGPCNPEQEGIVSKFSARLREGYLPHTYINPDFDPKAVAKRLREEGMNTPEPDAIWGFDPARMPQGDFEPDTYEMMTLCKKMHWPFFTIQMKLDALYDETLNQACRDGAAINNVSLKILRKAGYSVDEPGPNYTSYTYSMTMDKKIAQWWVHWTEVDPMGKRNFHMNRILPTVPIEGPSILSKLRDPTHTIIEWGLRTRMLEVKARYPAIFKADMEAQNKTLKRKEPAK